MTIEVFMRTCCSESDPQAYVRDWNEETILSRRIVVYPPMYFRQRTHVASLSPTRPSPFYLPTVLHLTHPSYSHLSSFDTFEQSFELPAG